MSLAKKLNLKDGAKLRVIGKPKDVDLGDVTITALANVFEMDKTFVPVIVLMVLGVSLTSLLKWVGRRIAPWSSANR